MLYVSVTVTVCARKVKCKGPRGVLGRDFRHSSVEMSCDGKKLTVQKWYGTRKELAAVRTVCSHIQNMIKGVTYVSIHAFLLYSLIDIHLYLYEANTLP